MLEQLIRTTTVVDGFALVLWSAGRVLNQERMWTFNTPSLVLMSYVLSFALK